MFKKRKVEDENSFLEEWTKSYFVLLYSDTVTISLSNIVKHHNMTYEEPKGVKPLQTRERTYTCHEGNVSDEAIELEQVV